MYKGVGFFLRFLLSHAFQENIQNQGDNHKHNGPISCKMFQGTLHLAALVLAPIAVRHTADSASKAVGLSLLHQDYDGYRHAQQYIYNCQNDLNN